MKHMITDVKKLSYTFFFILGTLLTLLTFYFYFFENLFLFSNNMH